MGADKALVSTALSTALFTPATIHRFTILLQTVLAGFCHRTRKNLVFECSKEKADSNIGFVMVERLPVAQEERGKGKGKNTRNTTVAKNLRLF